MFSFLQNNDCRNITALDLQHLFFSRLSKTKLIQWMSVSACLIARNILL